MGGKDNNTIVKIDTLWVKQRQAHHHDDDRGIRQSITFLATTD